MEQMIEILKKQLEIYKEILKISEDKTDIIIGDKVEELKPMVEREEELISGYISLEKDRIAVIKEFAKSKGITDVLKIDDLCEYFPENAEEMKALKKEVLDVTKKIKIKNELNEKLVDFKRGYETNGITPAEYEEFGPVVLFRTTFENAWTNANEYITKVMNEK